MEHGEVDRQINCNSLIKAVTEYLFENEIKDPDIEGVFEHFEPIFKENKVEFDYFKDAILPPAIAECHKKIKQKEEEEELRQAVKKENLSPGTHAQPVDKSDKPGQANVLNNKPEAADKQVDALDKDAGPLPAPTLGNIITKIINIITRPSWELVSTVVVIILAVLFSGKVIKVTGGGGNDADLAKKINMPVDSLIISHSPAARQLLSDSFSTAGLAFKKSGNSTAAVKYLQKSDSIHSNSAAEINLAIIYEQNSSAGNDGLNIAKQLFKKASDNGSYPEKFLRARFLSRHVHDPDYANEAIMRADKLLDSIANNSTDMSLRQNALNLRDSLNNINDL